MVAIVIGYMRWSTAKQDLSPEAQRHAIEQWCATRGAELRCVYEDEVSGGVAGLRTSLEGDVLTTRVSLADRPGLLAALRAATTLGASTSSRRGELRSTHPPAMIVAARRDRYVRDVEMHRVLARLVAPVRLIACDFDVGEGYLGQLTATAIDQAGELERGVIAERTRDALAVRSRQGLRVGSIPFGLTVAADGRHTSNCQDSGCPGCSTLAPHPTESLAVEVILRLDREGFGRRAICTALAQLGHRPRGAIWHPSTIARVLERFGAAADPDPRSNRPTTGQESEART